MTTKKVTRKISNKTRKNYTSNKKNYNYSDQNILCMFFQMLNTTKLYHWRTLSYPQHIATDSLYSDLNSKIDEFVEVLLGKNGRRVNLTSQKSIPLKDFNNINDFKREIENYKLFLINMNSNSILNNSSNTDLLNIRDEILGLLNKFTYLITFK